MIDETNHIATAAALLDDPYAALSQHLHGNGDAAWRTRALAAEAEVERLNGQIERLRGGLEAYATDYNWRFGGLFDPNSSRFKGTAIARTALAAMDTPKGTPDDH